MAKDVAAKKNTDIALSDVDSFLAENAGAGVQNLSQDDLALPFLKTLSRQDAVLDDLPDAKSGDIYNDATMEVYNGEEGLRVFLATMRRYTLSGHPEGQGQERRSTFTPPRTNAPNPKEAPTTIKITSSMAKATI